MSNLYKDLSIRKEKMEEILDIIEGFKVQKILLEEQTRHPKFLRIDRLKVKLQNGKILTRELIVKNCKKGSAVVMLPMSEAKDVLLVIEPRIATARTVGIGLPAGYIEEGESPVYAALRELREETGYTTNEHNAIKLASFYQDSGCSQAFNHAFLMQNCQKTHNQDLDKDEFIKYVTCHYDEALYLMEQGYINDSNSIITLEKSKKYVKELGGIK